MKDKFLEILDELIDMDYDEFHKSLQKHEPGDIAEFIIATGAIEAIFSSVKESDDNFDELSNTMDYVFTERYFISCLNYFHIDNIYRQLSDCKKNFVAQTDNYFIEMAAKDVRQTKLQPSDDCFCTDDYNLSLAA